MERHKSKPTSIKTYQYKGKTLKGEKIEGEIKADKPQLAKAILKKQGITTTKLTEKRKPLFKKEKSYNIHWRNWKICK